MIFNTGYRFDSLKKAWLAAFAVMAGTISFDASAHAEEPSYESHYELLDRGQVHEHKEQAIAHGDVEAAVAYDIAEKALQETQDGLRGTPADLPSDFKAKLFSEGPDHKLYKVIDPVADIDWTEFGVAHKTGAVKAEKVPPGTVVETVMANGMVETRKTAGEGGGYRVTNKTGEQYLVDTAKFEKLYVAGEAPGMFVPRLDPRKFVPIGRDVAFRSPWGDEMRIRAGGVLVHKGLKDVYGIQGDEFKATHAVDVPPAPGVA